MREQLVAVRIIKLTTSLPLAIVFEVSETLPGQIFDSAPFSPRNDRILRTPNLRSRRNSVRNSLISCMAGGSVGLRHVQGEVLMVPFRVNSAETARS